MPILLNPVTIWMLLSISKTFLSISEGYIQQIAISYKPSVLKLLHQLVHIKSNVDIIFMAISLERKTVFNCTCIALKLLSILTT